MSTPPDFRAALKQIRTDVPYLHHGRDPQKGLDCCGLILAVYRLAGLPIDSLDMPYAEKDAFKPHRNRLILSRLMIEFRIVGNGSSSIEWPVSTPGACQNGDVLLVGTLGRENHLAVAIDGTMVQMAGITGTANGHRQVVDGRLRVTSLARNWAWVSTVFRHQHLCEAKMGERRVKRVG